MVKREIKWDYVLFLHTVFFSWVQSVEKEGKKKESCCCWRTQTRSVGFSLDAKCHLSSRRNALSLIPPSPVAMVFWGSCHSPAVFPNYRITRRLVLRVLQVTAGTVWRTDEACSCKLYPPLYICDHLCVFFAVIYSTEIHGKGWVSWSFTDVSTSAQRREMRWSWRGKQGRMELKKDRKSEQCNGSSSSTTESTLCIFNRGRRRASSEYSSPLVCCPAADLNLLLSPCPQTWFPTIPWASSGARRNESELLRSRMKLWIHTHTHTHTDKFKGFSWRQHEDMLDISVSFLSSLVPPLAHKHTVAPCKHWDINKRFSGCYHDDAAQLKCQSVWAQWLIKGAICRNSCWRNSVISITECECVARDVHWALSPEC